MGGNKINIALVTANLMPGGAERVLSFLANELNSEEFEVTLVVFGFKKDTAYNIDNIKTVFFNKHRVLSGAFSFINYLRKNKPDIILSAVGHLNTLVAYISILFPKSKFVAREVSVLSILDTFDESGFNLFSYIAKFRFLFFDAIVCQSKDMLLDLKKHYKFNPNKLILINNPITNNFVVKDNSPKQDILKFITIGRFTKEKGHERLINILGKLTIPFHYTLIGSGPEKENIFNLINKYQLQNKVTYIDYTKEVPKYLAQNDVYLHGSYVEGFPNAVMESCAVGTPIIAFSAPGGLKEIIDEGVNGNIAENEEGFVQLIEDFYNSDKPDPKIVSNTITQKFNKEKIVGQYEDLFKNLIL